MYDAGGEYSSTSRGKWIGPGSCSAFRPPSPLNTKSGRKLAASGPTAAGPRAAYKVNTRKTKRRCHAG